MPDEIAQTRFEVSQAGTGAWSAVAQEQLASQNGRSVGGYVMGLMMAALLRESDRLGTPAALTGAFTAPVNAGAVEIATHLLRAGRSLQVWQAEMVQEERLCAQATVTFAQRAAGGARFQWIERPIAPPPESLPRNNPRPGAPRWLGVFDRCLVVELYRTPPDGISLMWMRDPDGGFLDYPGLTMFADMFPPRCNLALGPEVAFSTISNSIYFHATDEEIAGVRDDFVLMHGRGRRGSGGICDLTAEIWRRDGVLLATTEQLWWFR